MYNMVEKLALPIKVADRMDEITFLISILWTKKLKFRQVIKKLIKITQRSGEARIQVNIYLQRCSFYQITLCLKWGFPHSSAGKESACNAGDPDSIPESRRSAGEGIGYPLQYSWASLVVQLVKNLPTMWETWVQSLGWEDTLEKGKATCSSILAWRFPGTVQSMGLQRVGHN